MNIHVPPNHRVAERLRAEIEGEVLFDAASRGRYSTDASFYQIEPVGVVVPKRMDDVAAALTIAREEGVAVLPRGDARDSEREECGARTHRMPHEEHSETWPTRSASKTN